MRGEALNLTWLRGRKEEYSDEEVSKVSNEER
jgi:hypothetical protein